MKKYGLPDMDISSVIKYKSHHHLSDEAIAIIAIAILSIGIFVGWKIHSYVAGKKENKLYDIINSSIEEKERFLLNRADGKVYFKQTCPHCGRKYY